MGYDTKVYRKQGGSEMVVASGGTLTVESGGTVTCASGSTVTPPDASVTVAKLGASAVSGAKVLVTGFKASSFVGCNGANNSTLTGAVAGERVLALFRIDSNSGNIGTASNAFETSISANDKIAQLSNSDLSAQKFAVILIPASA